MSKQFAFAAADAGTDLTGRYWPEGVPRYVDTPDWLSLTERLIVRRSKWGPEGPVAIGSDRSLEPREFDETTGSVAANLKSAIGSGNRVALLLDRPIDTLVALFAAVRAGVTTLLLDPEAPGNAEILAEFSPTLVVADQPPGAYPSYTLDELTGAASPTDEADGELVPRIALRDGAGLVYHSETSLLSAARAFAAYFQLTPQDRLLMGKTPGQWEWLVGVLAQMEVDATAVVLETSQTDPLDAAIEAKATLLWMDGAEAERLLAKPAVVRQRLHDRLRLLMLSADRPFSVRVRRRLRREICPVITILGSPAAGPVAATSIGWSLDAAVGSPMTGVDLYPIDPNSCRIIEPPWELLTYAGIGVSSPAIATEMTDSVPGGIVEGTETYFIDRLGRLDANGLLYLL